MDKSLFGDDYTMTPWEQVEAVHAKALELGAENEGAPGGRGPNDAFYLAYFRDPDGNKIALFVATQ